MLRDNNTPVQVEGEATPALVEADTDNQVAPVAKDIDAQSQPTVTPTLIPPTATALPSPTVPLEPAIPNMVLESIKYLPVISGALFDREHLYLILQIRVENLGEEPFNVSTNQFSAITNSGQRFQEFGQNLAESEFRRLGVLNRFEDLTLRTGGSVAEDIVFYLPREDFEDFQVIYDPAGLGDLSFSIGPVRAIQELTRLLGTPTSVPALAEAATPTPTAAQDREAEATPSGTPDNPDARVTATEETPTTETTAVAENTETPTAETTAVAEASPSPAPTPTLIQISALPDVDRSGLTIPNDTLVGTIAYGDFNGTSYDLFFGNVANGTSILWRSESSQPEFSHSGERIAYHSWRSDSRGLISSNLDHSQGFLVTAFLEDQLPTWSADDTQILFLSRRSGTRQSELYVVPSDQERPEAQFLIEGEYPSWGGSNDVVFKGWVSSGVGLQIASSALTDYRALTDKDSDTAPSISPDGQRVVFMSNQDGNWDIYVVNVDGSNLQRLTRDAAQDGLPTWSPDGQAIAFVSNRGGPWSIWAMTTDGTGIRQLFTYNGSPDGFVASEPNTDTTRGWAEERISWSPLVIGP